MSVSDLANDSARRAFELSTEVIRGQTTHRPAACRRLLAGAVLQRASARRARDPVRRRSSRRRFESAAMAGRGGRCSASTRSRKQVSGTTLASCRGAARTSRGSSRSPAQSWFRTRWPRSSRSKRAQASTSGSTGRLVPVEVVGTMRSVAASAETEPPLVTDISTAQQLVGGTGSLSRIDLALSPGQARRLGDDPPSGTILVAAAGQSGRVDRDDPGFPDEPDGARLACARRGLCF